MAAAVAVAATVVAAVVTEVAAVAVAGDVASVNIGHYQGEQPPRRSILPGGAVLLEVPVATSKALSLGVWTRRGSTVEGPGCAGISHFLEHMVFKGSTQRSAYEIAAAFDSMGASIDAFTTKDMVAFTLKVLPEYFGDAVAVLADMLMAPAFEPEAIKLEQDVVCEEIQEVIDTPEDRLHDAYAAHVYGGHPRGNPILGTAESVRSFDQDILRREHAEIFAGQNLVFSLAGNLQPVHRELVAEAFAGAPTGSAADSPKAPTAPDSTRRQPSELVIQSSDVQTYFEFGNLGVSVDHPERVSLLMLSNLLGGGMSSRIFQAVREREGLAYTVYNYTDMGPATGLVSCAGSCSPEKEPRVWEVVSREYRRMLADGPTDAELDSNKAQIKSQVVFALEGVHNQMYRAAKNELFFGRFIPIAELVERVDAVDCEGIIRCAREWFDPDRLVHAVHRPIKVD